MVPGSESATYEALQDTVYKLSKNQQQKKHDKHHIKKDLLLMFFFLIFIYI